MKLTVAFDVDDTLIVPQVATGLGTDTPNYEIIALYRWFQDQGHEMIIWSGSGVEYAKRWAERLGLTADAFPVKGSRLVHVAFDDCTTADLGQVTVHVKRINNRISRRVWNETKGGPGGSQSAVSA